MLRIVAAAYRDGWAFVEDGDRTLLVRPPYRRTPYRDELSLRDPIEVPREAVQQAVKTHGFEVQTAEMVDLPALVAFLERRRVEIAEAEGALSLSDHERMKRLVQSAPRHILERYLDRVERELLPRGELAAALQVLTPMSQADVAHADDALRERVSELITACSNDFAWRPVSVPGSRLLDLVTPLEGLIELPAGFLSRWAVRLPPIVATRAGGVRDSTFEVQTPDGAWTEVFGFRLPVGSLRTACQLVLSRRHGGVRLAFGRDGKPLVGLKVKLNGVERSTDQRGIVHAALSDSPMRITLSLGTSVFSLELTFQKGLM